MTLNLSPEEAVRQAVANAALEGVTLSPDFVEKLREVAYGWINPDDLVAEVIAQARKRYSQPMAGFGFGEALQQLQAGYVVAREGWNGQGMWLALQRPDDSSKMTRSYIYIKTTDDQVVPWVASQTDLLATDWFIPQDTR